jgi:AcrR family transcriptional regulator
MDGPSDTLPPFATSPKSFPQERARRTYESLVDAAYGAFAASGFDNTQTPDIAAAAGVSVGTFYRYFTDKREIFIEVVRRFLATAYQEVMAGLKPERFVGAGQREAIDQCLRVLVDNTTANPELQRVIYEMALRDPDVRDLYALFYAESRRRLVEILKLATSSERVPDPEATAYVIETAAVELAVSLSGMRGEVPLSRERCLSALALMLEQSLFPGG